MALGNVDDYSFTYQDHVSEEEWGKKFADTRQFVMPLSQLTDSEVDEVEAAGYVVGVSGDYASKPGYNEWLDDARYRGRDVAKKQARRRHFNWMRRNGLYMTQMKIGRAAIAAGRKKNS